MSLRLDLHPVRTFRLIEQVSADEHDFTLGLALVSYSRTVNPCVDKATIMI